MMKLVLIVICVWLRMDLSHYVVNILYLWMLLAMTIHVSHFVLEMFFVTQTQSELYT